MKLGNVIRFDQIVFEVEVEGLVAYCRTATYTMAEEIGLYLHRELVVVPLEGEVQIVNNYAFFTDLHDVEGSTVEFYTFDDYCDSVDPVELAKSSVREFDFFEDEGFVG